MTYDSTLEQSYWSGTATHFCENTNTTHRNYPDTEGILDKLLNYVVGTEVNGLTLSGSGVGPYTATLNTPVGLGRAEITYEFSSVEYTAIDDGSGVLEGTNISSASVDHDTGAFTVTFTSPPDAAPTLDYIYGNPGADWKVMTLRTARQSNNSTEKWPTASDPEGRTQEVVLHNTGLSGSENIFVGIREGQYFGPTYVSSHFWNLNGYIDYTAGDFWNSSYNETGGHGHNNFHSTNDVYTYHPNMVFGGDIPTQYWFYSNRRRIMGAFKVQSHYNTFYIGNFRRYATQAEYSSPLFIKGMFYGSSARYSNVSSAYFVPYIYSTGSGSNAWFVLPDDTFMDMTVNVPADKANLVPGNYHSYVTVLNETLKGHVHSTPEIIACQTEETTYGDLDGVRHFFGHKHISEDLIDCDDGRKYRVFQNWDAVDYDDFVGFVESTS